MAKLTLSDISSGFQSASGYNANNDLIEQALENTLSLNGATPNSMTADFDVNSNDLLNVNSIDAQSMTIGGVSVVPGSTLTVPDAVNVPFTQNGTGAVLSNVEAKLNETFSVRDFGAVGNGVADDTAAIQAAIDHVESRNGGTVLLMEKHLTSSTLVIDDECVELKGYGSVFQTSVNTGTQILYSGSGVGILIDGIDGVRLKDFRIEATGTGTSGIHVLDAQQCLFENVKVREFLTDGWLVECSAAKSTIYNTWINCSGLRTTSKVANGLRMKEAVGKAVNNNVFINCDFGVNLVGIQQDTDANDNSFIGLELLGCTTGAVIRGRTHFIGANVESSTTGINLVSGSQAVIYGSIHFDSNTANFSNTGNRMIAANFHGNSTTAPSYNTTGHGIGYGGQVPPDVPGFNFPTTGGDPAIERLGIKHIIMESDTTRLNRSAYVPSGQEFSASAGWFSGPTTTTTALEDISNDVNTNTFKVQGTTFFNTTTNRPVWAAGNTDGAVWVSSDGTTAHTPV